MGQEEDFWEFVYKRAWRWSLRLYQFLWPIQVHNLWTENTASLLLELPASYPPSSLSLLHITDAHLSEDPLDVDHRPNAERMHSAFRSASSVVNGTQILPTSAFRDLVDLAAIRRVDLAALGGDIINFPQRRMVSWVAQTLNGSLRLPAAHGTRGSRIPFVYTAGNHDWFLEGSERSQEELWNIWRRRDLWQLYAESEMWRGNSDQNMNNGFDFGAMDLNGIIFLTVDNSLQQVSPEQLAFFRRQVLRWKPLVLMLHVPLAVREELRPFRGFALCGDPAWGEASDRSWRDERRLPWPKEGSSWSTKAFLEAVQDASAPNGPLVAVLAGHVHLHDETPFGSPNASATERQKSLGAVQYIGLPAFQGGHRFVQIASVSSASSSLTTPAFESNQPSGLEALHSARVASAALLDGLIRVFQSGAQIVGSPCWHDAPRGGVGVLDVAWVEAAVGEMLCRTEASMRRGFQGLAHALRPLVEHSRGATALCGETMLSTFGLALSELADLSYIAYKPGVLLDLGSARASVFNPINLAISALRRDASWALFGFYLGQVLQIISRRLASSDDVSRID